VVGKTEDEAKKIIDSLGDILDRACEDLHKTEGKITVTQNGAAFSAPKSGTRPMSRPYALWKRGTCPITFATETS
jgi:hypothetical protein